LKRYSRTNHGGYKCQREELAQHALMGGGCQLPQMAVAVVLHALGTRSLVG